MLQATRINGTELAARNGNGTADLMGRVVVGGDLKVLNADERLRYYAAVCDSVGLNPLTRPFEYIILNERLTLYATKNCTDQLRSLRNISTAILSRESQNDVYVVTAKATTDTGRSDESIGAVPLVKEGGEWKDSMNGKRYFQKNGQFHPLTPDDRANAMMKAETKAKRRATLSLCGLGMLDESEIESIRDARGVQADLPPGPVSPVTPDGAIDLSNDDAFFGEWDREAAKRNLNNAASCRNFLKVMCSSSRHRDHSSKPEWRREAMDHLIAGKFDEAMAPKKPTEVQPSHQPSPKVEPPKPVEKDGGDSVAEGNAGVASEEPTEQAVTVDDLQPMESFWAWMQHVMPKAAEKDIRAAVDKHAAGMRRTADQLKPEYLLRIYTAAKEGRFSIPGGRITDPPSVPLAQVVDETPL